MESKVTNHAWREADKNDWFSNSRFDFKIRLYCSLLCFACTCPICLSRQVGDGYRRVDMHRAGFIGCKNLLGLEESPWFWVCIVFSVAVQAPFILLVPWGNRSLSGISLLPVAVVDYGILYGCMKLVEKAAKRT
jgi:hypothetical protein